MAGILRETQAHLKRGGRRFRSLHWRDTDAYVLDLFTKAS
jgi:hypothetical protein